MRHYSNKAEFDEIRIGFILNRRRDLELACTDSIFGQKRSPFVVVPQIVRGHISLPTCKISTSYPELPGSQIAADRIVIRAESEYYQARLDSLGAQLVDWAMMLYCHAGSDGVVLRRGGYCGGGRHANDQHLASGEGDDEEQQQQQQQQQQEEEEEEEEEEWGGAPLALQGDAAYRPTG
ncbi:hypothetical protein BDW71DRAFT_205877 [Aspergillus fruticulosus]